LFVLRTYSIPNRGYNFDINADFLDGLNQFVQSIIRYVPNLSQYAFWVLYPFVEFLKVIANLNINFGSLTVTCQGSKAPIRLLIDCVILGIVIVVIESDYQMYHRTIGHVTKALFSKITMDHKHFPVVFGWSKWQTAVTLIGIIISQATIYFNPLLIVLRYLMGFVYITPFAQKYNVLHENSPSCDAIYNMPLDSVLAFAGSGIAWFLIMPVAYTLSKVLMPKLPLQYRWNTRPVADTFQKQGDGASSLNGEPVL
jgi:hypothetical protein